MIIVVYVLKEIQGMKHVFKIVLVIGEDLQLKMNVIYVEVIILVAQIALGL